METKEEVKSIVILGRRWFERVNGNTYFSAEIFVNGNHVHKIDYEYGYGDQYAHEAGAWLDKNGWIALERYSNGSAQPLWYYCRDHGISLIQNVVDVQRKKNL